MLGTVRKAGLVLDLFVDGQSEWGVTEVAEELEVPKSGAHSILATLAEIGLLERTEDKRYRLGWQVVALSRVALDTTDLRAAAAPLMHRLAVAHSASSLLAVRERGRALCIERYPARATVIPGAPKVGDYLQGSHAAARMLFRCAPRKDGNGGQAGYMDRVGGDEPATTVDELTSPRAGDGRPASRVIRQAVAPVCACGSRVVAALSVCLPGDRFTCSSATALVTHVASRISRQLMTDAADADAPRPSEPPVVPRTFVKAERAWPVGAGRG